MQDDVLVPCCHHAYGRHNDLTGCAVEGCECGESKATIYNAELDGYVQSDGSVTCCKACPADCSNCAL